MLGCCNDLTENIFECGWNLIKSYGSMSSYGGEDANLPATQFMNRHRKTWRERWWIWWNFMLRSPTLLI